MLDSMSVMDLYKLTSSITGVACILFGIWIFFRKIKASGTIEIDLLRLFKGKISGEAVGLGVMLIGAILILSPVLKSRYHKVEKSEVIKSQKSGIDDKKETFAYFRGHHTSF